MVRSMGAKRACARGFTLIEASLAIVIVGVAVLALVEAQSSFLRTNAWSTQSATGTYLANEIRELSRTFTRHDPVTSIWVETDGSSSILRGWGPEAGELSSADFDDLDDLDGLRFGEGGNQAGPIDGFGNVIPQLNPDGTVELDSQGNPVPMRGWSQEVRVEKVDPFNNSLVRDKSYLVAAVPPDFPGRAVDGFPLRVTVIVRYRGDFDPEALEMARVVWIVP
ncbi:MAG: prepilin-type N-terminal cleavage/methylation domain-containing protein [Phycisphaerae bacterium]|nr:prepilin-type N-terminal cleavage/methylation domain-containing protein [Phycisphaerae bacterium]